MSAVSTADAGYGDLIAAVRGRPKPRGEAIAPRLVVSAIDDPLEREADRMANTALAGGLPTAPTRSPHGVQRKCTQCEDEEEDVLREASTDAGAGPAPEQVSRRIDARRGSGVALGPATRSFFEPRFRRDFGQVRVHADAEASQLARAIHAQAFTVGNDIYFGAGKHEPGSAAGRQLLAHELSHVVQQSPQVARRPTRIQRQSIHSPLFPCFETSLMPGGMDFFGTLVHLAIQQHYVRNIDPLAGTEYVIPGSGPAGGNGRADIVSSIGGIYEIKPVGLAGQAFTEALGYVAAAEAVCDRHVNWHLGTVYFPPSTPMVIGDTVIRSWLNAPGVIAYALRRRPRQPDPVPVPVPRTAPRTVPQPVAKTTRQLIQEFARRVYEGGLDATTAAEEFFRQHPDLVATVAGLGIVAILALLADDATVVGIADDVLIPIIAAMEWVALRLLVFA